MTWVPLLLLLVQASPVNGRISTPSMREVYLAADFPDQSNVAVPDEHTISNYQGGTYAVYTLSGDVTLRLLTKNGPNAVLSGVFIGAPSTAPLGFVKTDTATQGTWKGTYGSAGWAIAGDQTQLPAGVTFTLSGQSAYTWQGSTTDPRGLQVANSQGRIMSAWYGGDFSVTLHLDAPRTVAFYLADYDPWNREAILALTTSSLIVENHISAWEVSTTLNGETIQTLRSTIFPDRSAIGFSYTLPASLFPVANTAYVVNLRWRATLTDASGRVTYLYTPWIAAAQKVVRQADGTYRYQ